MGTSSRSSCTVKNPFQAFKSFIQLTTRTGRMKLLLLILLISLAALCNAAEISFRQLPTTADVGKRDTGAPKHGTAFYPGRRGFYDYENQNDYKRKKRNAPEGASMFGLCVNKITRHCDTSTESCDGLRKEAIEICTGLSQTLARLNSCEAKEHKEGDDYMMIIGGDMVTGEELKKMFAEIDTNGNGVFEIEEMMKTFAKADTDGNNIIDPEEFRNSFPEGEMMTEVMYRHADRNGVIEVEDMMGAFAEVDTNNDGVIDFEEYRNSLLEAIAYRTSNPGIVASKTIRGKHLQNL